MRDLRGPREMLCWDRRVILIDPGTGPAERRCSLGHAVAHLDLGHRLCRPDLRAEVREEIDADIRAARKLIHIDALLDAFRWTERPVEACDELDVDIDMLKVRGAHLHPGEKQRLREVLAAKEGTA